MDDLPARLTRAQRHAAELRAQMVMLEHQRLTVQTQLLRLEGAIALLEDLIQPHSSELEQTIQSYERRD